MDKEVVIEGVTNTQEGWEDRRCLVDLSVFSHSAVARQRELTPDFYTQADVYPPTRDVK